MQQITSNSTGYGNIVSQFDKTTIDNPFYETTSSKGTLIEYMKNNVLVIEETNVDLDVSNKKDIEKKESNEREED